MHFKSEHRHLYCNSLRANIIFNQNLTETQACISGILQSGHACAHNLLVTCLHVKCVCTSEVHACEVLVIECSHVLLT